MDTKKKKTTSILFLVYLIIFLPLRMSYATCADFTSSTKDENDAQGAGMLSHCHVMQTAVIEIEANKNTRGCCCSDSCDSSCSLDCCDSFVDVVFAYSFCMPSIYSTVLNHNLQSPHLSISFSPPQRPPRYYV